jgi:circadian clock protein KaiB
VRLCLYVAAGAPNSMAARANLSAALEASGREHVTVAIVDVFERPDLAVEDQVYVTPMLIRVSPLPRCRIIGNLSDRTAVLQLLQVEASGSKT